MTVEPPPRSNAATYTRSDGDHRAVRPPVSGQVARAVASRVGTGVSARAGGGPVVRVRLHLSPGVAGVEDRKMHEELGFHDGWGTVIGQLAAFVEG